MEIKKIVVGFLKANCYLLIKDNHCLIVDPGDDYNIIKASLNSLNIVGILITHQHPDHIGALDELLSDYRVAVYDKDSGEGHHNIETFSFDIIETKGHADDAITFYFSKEEVMFSGDFLFKGTIGRTDLPTSSDLEMNKSLNKIKTYSPNIMIYPGHGSESNLGYELKNNPYLKNR